MAQLVKNPPAMRKTWVGKTLWRREWLPIPVFWPGEFMDEVQAGIKIAGRNINNLRYAEDATLMAESQEELKNLLMKVKESEKPGLKLNFQKMKIMVSGPITSWQIGGETMENSDRLYFLGLQNHCRW